jgi:hypothetical protein
MGKEMWISAGCVLSDETLTAVQHSSAACRGDGDSNEVMSRLISVAFSTGFIC